MSPGPSTTERFMSALGSAGKVLVAVLVAVNALLLVPSACFGVAVGRYLPTIAAMVMSALFWLACYAVLRIVRARRHARLAAEPSSSELTPTRPLPVQALPPRRRQQRP